MRCRALAGTPRSARLEQPVPDHRRDAMHSEWMKVMLEEIARKRDEATRARREQELRLKEQEAAGATVRPAASSRPVSRRTRS